VDPEWERNLAYFRRPLVLGDGLPAIGRVSPDFEGGNGAEAKQEAEVQLGGGVEKDRLIKHGVDSTTSEWLRECCEMERDYDSYPQETTEGSAALTGWPYSEPVVDMVNSPRHYQLGKYEVIDVIDEWFPNDPHLFTAVQYIARAAHKGNLKQDLEKAIWYINRRIKRG
jgi:hypothetical protein